MLGSAAVALAAASAVVAIATVNDDRLRTAILVAVALGLFVIGLVAGSISTVQVATVPMLSAVAWDILVTTEQVWSRSLIIGCLWFCAVEAGILTIQWRELRRLVRRSDLIDSPVDVNMVWDRLSDVVFVVGASSVAVVCGAAVSIVAVSRTVLAQSVGLFLVALAIGMARKAAAADSD